MTVRRPTADRRDQEISRLRRQLAEAKAREREVRVEERERFSALTAASKRFASSMRSRMDERQRQQRRLDAQYAVSRVLEESRDLATAAPGIFRALETRLGWDAGILWTVEDGSLVCTGTWRSGGDPVEGLAAACRAHRLPRGAGLPGRVWRREEPCWIEDVLGDEGYLRREAAAAEGLRCALAFPIQDGGRLVGVFELLKREPTPVEEDTLSTVHLIGHQMGQFVERRRAEAERDRALLREKEARRQVSGVLESINDAFFAVDRDWRLTYVNRRAEEFWRRSRDELLGENLWEEFPEAAGAEAERNLRRAMGSEETVGFETLAAASGAWISARAYPSPEGLSVYLQDITKRKEAEEALRASERRFRALVSKGADMITVSDRDGNIVYASPTTELVSGYTPEEFVALHPFDTIHPEDRPRCEDAFRRLMDEPGLSLDLRHRGRHKDGSWLWIEGSFTSLFHDPAIGGIVANVRDVTERRKAEERLAESEARFRATFEQARVGIAEVSLDARVLLPNAGFCNILGYKEEEARGLHVRDFTHPDDYDTDMEQAARVVAGEIPGYSIEKRYVRKDGRVVWVNLTSTLVRDASGEPDYALAVVEDIDERKKAGEALRESEERLRRAVDIETVGVLFFDTAGRITDANDAFLGMSGYDRDDLEAGLIRWDEMTPPEWMPRTRQAQKELREIGTSTPYEKEYVRKDGSRWWGLFAGKSLGGNEAVEFVLDVTGRKKDEQVLHEQDEWLRIAQRAAQAGTWEWVLATGEVRWSAEHHALFGLAPSDEPMTRETWWGAIHPDDLPRIEEAGRRCSEEGEEWPEIEYRIFRDGETRWIDARGRTVRDDSGRPVRILGISVDVTEKKEVEAERDRLRAQEWVAAAEVAERERISRELHDRVAHSMGVAHQSLQLHDVLVGKDPARAAEKLGLAKEMTKASLESTRNLSTELRSQEAEEGLEIELRHLLEVAVPPGVQTEISVRGDEAPVPGYVRGQLFLILREAVRNAVTHSGCATISVGLEFGPEKVTGRVEDDGRGFDVANGHAGVGLRSMRERTALLDGALDLSCEPGRGTRVAVSVPLKGGR